MTETQAIVIALDGEHAIVRAEQDKGCGRCHEPGGCGGNNLVQMMCASKPQDYRVLNPVAAKVGERVTVAVAEGVISRSAVLMYGFPLFFLFIGAFLGAQFAGSDVGAVLGGGLGLLVGWFLVVTLQQKLALNRRFQPTILLRN